MRRERLSAEFVRTQVMVGDVGHIVGLFEQCFRVAEMIGIPYIVGIQKGDPITCGLSDPNVSCTGRISQISSQDGRLYRKLTDLRYGVIGGTVVNDDRLVWSSRLLLDATQSVVNPTRSIMAGNYDRNAHGKRGVNLDSVHMGCSQYFKRSLEP